MTDEKVSDRMPAYVHNTHTSYENTVLAEHAAITSDREGKTITNTILEVRARLFIGICLTDKAAKFVDDNWEKVYDAEYTKLANTKYNKDEKESAAIAGMWTELMNMATTYFVKKYKVDGAKAKIAVIDTITSDGCHIVELDCEPEVCFTADNEGV